MPDTHTARDALRRAVAAEFQRLDAHDWGYDHGFCADPDSDEETAAFVDAAIRIVLTDFAQKIRDDALLDIDGLDDECCRNYGLALARWMDEQPAAPTTPTPKEK